MVPERTDDQLAEAAAAALRETPDLTVAQLADQLDAEAPDVARVLDSYFVTPTGAAVYAGAGQGGGWTAQE